MGLEDMVTPVEKVDWEMVTLAFPCPQPKIKIFPELLYLTIGQNLLEKEGFERVPSFAQSKYFLGRTAIRAVSV